MTSLIAEFRAQLRSKAFPPGASPIPLLRTGSPIHWPFVPTRAQRMPVWLSQEPPRPANPTSTSDGLHCRLNGVPAGPPMVGVCVPGAGGGGVGSGGVEAVSIRMTLATDGVPVEFKTNSK